MKANSSPTFQGNNQTQGLAVQHINAALIANKVNDTETVKKEIEVALGRITPVEDRNPYIFNTKMLIYMILVTFSLGAFFGILYILLNRRNELRKNALMVFKYLAVREAYNIARRKIGVDNKNIENAVKAVEEYLTNSNRTLARITVDEMVSEYHELYFQKADEKEPKLR